MYHKSSGPGYPLSHILIKKGWRVGLLWVVRVLAWVTLRVTKLKLPCESRLTQWVTSNPGHSGKNSQFLKPAAHESYLLTAKFIRATCLTQKRPCARNFGKVFGTNEQLPKVARTREVFALRPAHTRAICLRQSSFVQLALRKNLPCACNFR